MRRLKVFLLAAVTLLLVAASTAQAVPRTEVGLQDDDVFIPRFGVFFPLDQALDTARTLSVSYIRTQVVWSNALGLKQSEQRRVLNHPKYDWSYWDSLIAAAKTRGIRIQMVITGPAPAWATGDHKVGVFKPNAKLYGKFVYDAVKHFRGRVKRFSLWNEPNWIGWLSPVRQQISLYRALYTSAYAAARRAYPGAQIFLGETSAYQERGLSTAPLALMRGVLCLDGRYRKIKRRHCRPLAANGYAQHPYDLLAHSPTYRFPGNDNVTIGTLSRLTSALDRAQKSGALRVLGAQRMPVYLTEFGYRLKGRGSVSDSRRAGWLVQAFKIAQKNPRVRQLLQFQLVRPALPSHSFWQAYLLGFKGEKTKTYNALLSWTRYAAKHHLIAQPGPF